MQFTFALLVLVTLSPFAGGSTPIYSWVDETGSVHYSDEPPPRGARDVRAMQLDIAPAAEGAAEDYSIQRQLERLYRSRPPPPEKPAKVPPPPVISYPPAPRLIYHPLYVPDYGRASKHRPAHPSWQLPPPHQA